MSKILEKLENVKNGIDEQINEIDQKIAENGKVLAGTSVPDLPEFNLMAFKVKFQDQGKFLTRIAQMLGHTDMDEFEVIDQQENSIVISLPYDEMDVVRNELGAQFSFSIPEADDYKLTLTDPLATFDIAGYVTVDAGGCGGYGESTDEDDDINEALVKKKVVRGGKKIIKWISTKEGFRVQMINGKPKEVKMKPEEIKKRAKGAKKAQKKKNPAKQAQAARKREKSLRKKGDSE
jgi:hypothetical protein